MVMDAAPTSLRSEIEKQAVPAERLSRALAPIRFLLIDDGAPESLSAVRMITQLPLPPGSYVFLVGLVACREAISYAVRLANLEQIQDQLNRAGVKSGIKLLAGAPVEALTAYAQQVQAHMVIVGGRCRPRSPLMLEGSLLGLVEKSPIPLFLVRPGREKINTVIALCSGSEDCELALEAMIMFPFPEEVAIRVLHTHPGHAASGRYEEMIKAPGEAPAYIEKEQPDLLVSGLSALEQLISRPETFLGKGVSLPCSGSLLVVKEPQV